LVPIIDTTTGAGRFFNFLALPAVEEAVVEQHSFSNLTAFPLISLSEEQLTQLKAVLIQSPP
jgi:hypothetical protein